MRARSALCAPDGFESNGQNLSLNPKPNSSDSNIVRVIRDRSDPAFHTGPSWVGHDIQVCWKTSKSDHKNQTHGLYAKVRHDSFVTFEIVTLTRPFTSPTGPSFTTFDFFIFGQPKSSEHTCAQPVATLSECYTPFDSHQRKHNYKSIGTNRWNRIRPMIP